MHYDVELQETDPEVVAMLRRTTDLSTIHQVVDGAFATLLGAITAVGGTPTGQPFITSHGRIDEHTAADLDICVPIAPDLPLDGDVERAEVPAQLVATTVHQGPYEQLAPAYTAVREWIARHDRTVAGPPRERYLSDPGRTPAAELRTAVQWPVERDG